jgi:hypothetical protein
LESATGWWEFSTCSPTSANRHLKSEMTAAQPIESPVNEARFVREAGYDGCIELRNATTRVVLEPNLGGRVLNYQLNGAEILYQNRAQNGAVWDGQTKVQHPSAGRFDIGPEYEAIPHDEFWLGRWTAERVSQNRAKLTSVKLGNGLQLIREFTLVKDSSHLRCTHIFRNQGVIPLRTFHWSRTFVAGNGIALAPLPKNGRFPRGYALGGPANIIDFQPAEEPNVRVRENILEILGAPSKAKFILDVEPGWLVYLAQNDLLFLKQFPVYTNRPYGEIAANNASIWYSGLENSHAWPFPNFPVEIEAIGPLEMIEPGGERSFTEDWWLEEFPFPQNRTVELKTIRALIDAAKTGDQ